MGMTAIGSFVPQARASNEPLARKFGKDVDFLEHKLGFMARARKESDCRTSDLCVRAFADLERITALDRGKVRLLAVVTQNPDQRIPHTAAIVHQKLKLDRECATFDIGQACAGYPHGVAIVEGLMRTYRIDQAVLLTCDPYDEIIDPDDPATAMLFGHAATATLMTRADDGYVLRDVVLGTAPDSYQCLVCEDRFVMDGRSVTAHAAHEVPDAVRALLSRNGLCSADVPFYAFHQASRYVVELLRTRLGLTERASPFAASDVGNTVSSSIPLLLKERLNRAEDERIVMCGFGVGFSWGVGLLEKTSRETKP